MRHQPTRGRGIAVNAGELYRGSLTYRLQLVPPSIRLLGLTSDTRAAASRAQAGRPVSGTASGNARLLAKFLVAVAPECGAGRGHVGCVCSLGERRDGDQRDQRESSDEFPHDTSPCYGTLSKPTEFVSKLALSHMGLKESFDNREKTECLHCHTLIMGS